MEKLQGRDFVLGFQHLFAMFGATVVVPLLTGLSPAVALFTAGVGTLLFHLVTGKKVPVFLGSSFAFIAAIATIVQTYGKEYAGGGIMAAGAVYFIFSLIVYLLGVEKVKNLVPPVVTGPIIVVIGLTLSPVAINDITTPGGQAATGTNLIINWLVALLVVSLIVGVMIFNKGFFKLVPILIGITGGYLTCIILDLVGATGDTPLVNFAAINQAKWLNFGLIVQGKFFTFPKFDWSAIVLIAPLAIVTFMEHIGDITTNGSVVGKDFFKDPGLHRTLIGDGIATMVAGFFGGPANTTYSENTGVLAVTKVYNPRILRIAAFYAIALSMCGKFGAIIQAIPWPVMGGACIILYGIIASIGMRTMFESKLDFSHSRNLLIVAVILVLGLGVDKIFITQTIFVSGLAIAAVVGIIANQILPQEV